MRPPLERDPWSWLIALACLWLFIAIVLIALAGGNVS